MSFKLKHKLYNFFTISLFYIFRIFPIQDKIVATTMRGRKYGDNPQFIFEALHREKVNLNFVWLVNKEYNVKLPSWVRPVNYYKDQIRLVYELSTSKVWINTHRYESTWRKRNGQLVIETWHGGLGLKKIEGDVEKVRNTKWEMKEINNTISLSDVFISQSDHLSNIYRRAFGYQGPIYKCGYPKNDCMFSDRECSRKNVMAFLGRTNVKVLLYAPTMREGDQGSERPNMLPYNIQWDRLYCSLVERFGGDWILLVKWHPVLANTVPADYINSNHVIDVTKYQDMQELIKAADIMISDYSSCLFDGALLGIPCFSYATDFDKYKEDRGVYYEMEELPFPYAKNNDELISNILSFNDDDYKKRWLEFKERTGLYESGHAAVDIASKIIEFVNTGETVWS
ncbi:MAG: CDP-glycerol glycerophosphotransferase family protein [Paludibacteraceae bacterium]|nr:CDP-glycerol glycerophosphotransferase family protein [Paludibacteraceae bacterium]